MSTYLLILYSFSAKKSTGTLTDEMSQVTGIGPVCAGYVGVKHPKNSNDVAKFKEDMSNKIDEIGEFEFWIPKRAIIEWKGTAGVMLRW